MVDPTLYSEMKSINSNDCGKLDHFIKLNTVDAYRMFKKFVFHHLSALIAQLILMIVLSWMMDQTKLDHHPNKYSGLA